MYRILIALQFLLALAYVVLQYEGWLFYAVGTKAVFLLVLLLLYKSTVNDKRLLFSLFLITFFVGEVVYFSTWYMEDESWNTFYYVTNLFYIIAYIFLLASILRDVNIKDMIKSYPLQLVILLAMSVFSVVYISFSAEYDLAPLEFLLEVVYNTVVMTLLSIALLNYVMKQDSRAMTLLLASILMVFSEMLQYANNYVAEFSLLRAISSTFSVVAFVFFYVQAKMIPQIQLDYLKES